MIVIRDIHHYGDDLTVPEAIARLCDGGQVTVTVTDPAPPGGDPRGNPRYGFDITVRPAFGGQPELPPEISWEARSFETPDSAALFAEALTLASQLAACRDITARLDVGDLMVYDLYDTPALSGQHGIRYDTVDLTGDLGLVLADDSPANGRGGVLHRRRRSLLGRGRAHRPRPRRPAPASQHPARRGMNPGRAKAPDTATLIGKLGRRSRLP